MITSTYGIKLPENGDKGAPVFSAINANFTYLRDHKHDGTTGTKVVMSDITKELVNLAAAGWTSTGDGKGYTQQVTCPGSTTLANSTIRFRIRTGGQIHKVIYPTITPVSLTIFTVLVNDNTLDLEVLFV